MSDEQQPDPMFLIDSMTEWLEGVRGMVALLVNDGFTEREARAMVATIITMPLREQA